MSTSAPSYDEKAAQRAQETAALAQAKYGTYGVKSPLGTLNIVQNPDGTYSKSYSMNAADQTRTNLIQQGLSGLSLDPIKAQNAYYQQATRLLQPQMQTAQNQLEERLINRGLTPGSEQYDRQMKNLQDQQAGTLSDISNQSIFQGQNLLGSQIGNIGALAGQRDILGVGQLGGNTGAQLQETYTPSFQSQLQKAAGKNALYSGIGNLAGLAIGGFLGGL